MNIPDKMNCWSQFPAMVGYAACYEALAEECMELAHCALELKPNADISVWKWERHKKRLEEALEREGDN